MNSGTSDETGPRRAFATVEDNKTVTPAPVGLRRRDARVNNPPTRSASAAG